VAKTGSQSIAKLWLRMSCTNVQPALGHECNAAGTFGSG
jgi:hypothetical protein